jgi:general secretion pathway protein H
MLVTLALAGLAAALVTPRVVDSLASQRSRAAIRGLAVCLAEARAHAVRTQGETLVTIDTDSHEIVAAPLDRRFVIPSETHVELVVAAVEKVATNIGGVRFFPDGSSTGASIRISTPAVAGEIAVHWLTGRVSVSFAERNL